MCDDHLLTSAMYTIVDINQAEIANPSDSGYTDRPPLPWYWQHGQ